MSWDNYQRQKLVVTLFHLFNQLFTILNINVWKYDSSNLFKFQQLMMYIFAKFNPYENYVDMQFKWIHKLGGKFK